MKSYSFLWEKKKEWLIDWKLTFMEQGELIKHLIDISKILF